MPMSEAQRRANRKWANANITNLSCKVRKDKAEAFKAACYANDTSPNAVLVAAMNAFMETHGGWETWAPVEDDSGQTQSSAQPS